MGHSFKVPKPPQVGSLCQGATLDLLIQLHKGRQRNPVFKSYGHDLTLLVPMTRHVKQVSIETKTSQ